MGQRQDPAGRLIAAGFLAGEVYFLGSLDGTLRAYDGQDGSQIWSAGAPGPITISVWADDRRVFVSTGTPGVFGAWANGKNTVTAYAVPE